MLYQEMRGRGTRLAPSISKTSLTIFDFTGVTDFHGGDEDVPADGGFVVTAEKGKARRVDRNHPANAAGGADVLI
nr:hypothetical protein [uncultured Rhodopila sp.]